MPLSAPQFKQFKEWADSVLSEIVHLRETQQDQSEKAREMLEILRSNEEKRATAEEDEQRRHRQKLRIKGLLVLGAWLAFVAAAFYAWEAHKQLGEMRQSAGLSRQAMERQLSPHLVYAGGDLSKDGKVSVTFRNTGQSPAFATGSWWSYAFMVDPTPFISEDHKLDSVFGIGAPGELKQDIGGGNAEYPLPGADNHAVIKPAELLAGLKANRILFVWGIVKYRDLFQNCQHTAFVAESVPGADGKSWTLAPYHESSSEPYACNSDRPFGEQGLNFSWYGRFGAAAETPEQRPDSQSQ